MSDSSAILRERLGGRTLTWLVTGAAGFIGSNLVETLLQLDQRVVGLDNFDAGHMRNLDAARAAAGAERAARFQFFDGSIEDAALCASVCEGADYVLHQAAMGSVPRSIEEPAAAHQANVTGFLNILIAARDAGVRRVVYASSSAVYGDEPTLPKREDLIGEPLSPYAATKWMDEIYAGVFGRAYGLQSAGLRYFNVFGPRQDPEGAYAAVIPKWIAALRDGRQITINGDGSATRDFCYIANVVQANLLAALTDTGAPSPVFNVAVQEETNLNELFAALRALLAEAGLDVGGAQPSYGPERAGDIQHSVADISRIREALGYAPTHSLAQGVRAALPWYLGE